MKRAQKQPADWVTCPKCNQPYTFMSCRITLPDKSSICLHCAVQEQRDKVKGVAGRSDSPQVITEKAGATPVATQPSLFNKFHR